MSNQPNPDLAKFAQGRDETAFRRVVAQYGKLVLTAARRRTDDLQLAEEVAQNVFAIMARKAKRLAKHRSLAGWVFTTTRLESAKALRGRQRHRRKLEALAEELKDTTDMSPEDQEHWRDALPHLEAGLDQLGDADREALLARYFEDRSFKQIASATGRSEAACRMRVHRSLDKLRGWMARRGVTLSAAAVATGLGAEWTGATPAAAVSAISSNAVAAAPALGSGTIISNTLMTMNATKSTCLAAAAVIAIGAVPIAMQQAQANRLESEIAQFDSRSADPHSTEPALSALQKQAAGGPGPARRILREARLPDDPAALTRVLLDAVMEQDLGALMRAMVALGNMSQAEIDDLITRINQSDMHLGQKQAARRMLIGFMDADETDGAALLEKAIDSDLQLFHTLGKRLARWAAKDPAAAAAWIEQHHDDPRLNQSTGSNRIGELIWKALVPGMARTDPALAIAQLDSLGSRADWTTVAAVAGSIIGRGGEGDPELAKEVLVRLPSDRLLGGIGVASQQPMSIERFDAFAQLVRSLDLSEKRIAGRLYWLATTQGDVPARQRADWVLDNVGVQEPSSLRNFIWNTRQREAELGEWIGELPPGEFKDHALRGEISALVNNLHNGGEAIARARLIRDDELRSEALRFIVGKIPDAAAQAPAAANADEVAELSAALVSPTKPSKPLPAADTK